MIDSCGTVHCAIYKPPVRCMAPRNPDMLLCFAKDTPPVPLGTIKVSQAVVLNEDSVVVTQRKLM